MPTEVVLLIFSSIIVIVIVRILGEWLINNSKPKIQSHARIIDIDTRRSGEYVKVGQKYATNLNPTYDITFEFSNGDRKLIVVPVEDNDWVCEGVNGILTLQGTRFIGFEIKECSTSIGIGDE